MSLGTVLFVSALYPPHVGGVEQYVSHLAGELVRSKQVQRAVVVTATPHVATDLTADPAAGAATPVVRSVAAQAIVSTTPVSLTWGRRLRAILAEEKPDLINAHAPVPGLADVAARVAGDVPFVLTYHAGPMRKGRPLVDLALRGYESVVVRGTATRADRIICSSRYVQESMTRCLPGTIEVISAGADTTLFAPRLPQPEGRVLFVGSLYRATRYKGLDTLLAAAALMLRQGRALHVDVVGDGDARAEYEAQCRHLGISRDVTFHGALDRDGVALAYQHATLVALPSRFDSLPTALVEAMACGRPVVTTAVGGIPELVDHGRNGLLVSPDRPDQLADALTRVLADPPWAQAMGDAGLHTVQTRLSWRMQAERTAQVFQDAIASRRSRTRTGTRTGTWTWTRNGTGTDGTGPNTRTRVAVITPYYPPHTGGVERYAERVAAELRRQPDLDGVVITSRRGLRSVTEDRDGTPVIRIGAWARLSNTPVSPLWPWTVSRLLARHGVDVVNVHAPVPYLADVAMLVAGSRPVVMTYHSGSLVKGGHRTDGLLRWYERQVLGRLFRRADALIAVSPASLAWPTGRAQLVTPGVDIERFRPPDPPAHRDRVLLYVGRMERSSSWKGVEVLIDALAAVRDCVPGAVLELVGTGDARHDLAARACRLGLDDAVRFRGELHGDDLVRAYQGAAVVVLPSRTEAESFGMVLVEAMACGTPVVACRVGGVPFVVRNGVDGLLVAPGDAAELARACSRLLTDDVLARSMGAAGRDAAVDRFSWTHGMADTTAIFRAVTGRVDPGAVVSPVAAERR